MDSNQIQNYPQTTSGKTNVKDFFLNLGAIVALYTTVVSLLNLLFRVINTAYPQITSYYSGSQSISFPVATLIIFFPVYILLMWLLERGYKTEPEKRHIGVRRWLTYITLFISGLTLAGDLVTVIYYFIDGQELTAGFLLKILSVFIIILMVFLYYITDIRNKLTSKNRIIWLSISCFILLASVVWGFSVLGSPRTQQLIKFDTQRISDLQNIKYQVENYYSTTGSIPDTLSDLTSKNTYNTLPLDPQTKQNYEYNMIGQSAKGYELCATFNRSSSDVNKGGATYPVYDYNNQWQHPEGHYCFSLAIPVSDYKVAPPVPAM